jgi:hypothetical protein
MAEENKLVVEAGFQASTTNLNPGKHFLMIKKIDYALTLFWVRMHLVQRFRCLVFPSTTIVAGWTLGVKRRLVCRLEWLTFSPNMGVFPQISHFKI